MEEINKKIDISEIVKGDEKIDINEIVKGDEITMTKTKVFALRTIDFSEFMIDKNTTKIEDYTVLNMSNIIKDKEKDEIYIIDENQIMCIYNYTYFINALKMIKTFYGKDIEITLLFKNGRPLLFFYENDEKIVILFILASTSD